MDQLKQVLESLNNETEQLTVMREERENILEKIRWVSERIDIMNNKIEMCNMVKIRPFLKWVGGKTQIMPEVLKSFPKTISSYHEMFLGGGSVLFDVLYLKKTNKIVITNDIYAYDINEALINVYKHIQTNKEQLLSHISRYLSKYESAVYEDKKSLDRKATTEVVGLKSKENYYYYMRYLYNGIKLDEDLSIDKLTEKSALFMLLNKLCFRGVYREGPNGFNVPFGHYKTTPHITTEGELNEISELIKDVSFVRSDFEDSFNNVSQGDFMYLDPPYVPIKKTSFVGYNESGFSEAKYRKLFSLIKTKGVCFSMSNSCCKLVTDEFKEKKYVIKKIMCKRSINSKNPESKVMEVIINCLTNQ